MSSDFSETEISEVCGYMNEQMSDTCVYLVKKLTHHANAKNVKLVDISFTSATFQVDVEARTATAEIRWPEPIVERSEVRTAFMALLHKAQSH